MRGVHRKGRAKPADCLTKHFTTKQRVAEIVENIRIVWLDREGTQTGGLGLRIKLQAQISVAQVMDHLTGGRVFLFSADQVADCVGKHAAIDAQHAQKMQCVGVVWIGVYDLPAASLRRLPVARRVKPRRLADIGGGLNRHTRFFPAPPPARTGFGCCAAAARLGFGAGLGGAFPERRSAIVARVVICSGFMRSSITAGRPLSTARMKAGAKAAVSFTTSPWPPNASMSLAKSGLVSAVPDTRHG